MHFYDAWSVTIYLDPLHFTTPQPSLLPSGNHHAVVSMSFSFISHIWVKSYVPKLVLTNLFSLASFFHVDSSASKTVHLLCFLFSSWGITVSWKIIWKLPFQWCFLRSPLFFSPWFHSTLFIPKAYHFLLYYSSLFSLPHPWD